MLDFADREQRYVSRQDIYAQCKRKGTSTIVQWGGGFRTAYESRILKVQISKTGVIALVNRKLSDTCRERAIGTTVQRRRWMLISHIATLSFPAHTISSPIVHSSDPGFRSFVPRILSSQSHILAPSLLFICATFCHGSGCAFRRWRSAP